MPQWLEIASGVAAALAVLLGSVAIIYRKAIRPVTRGVAVLLEAVPTVLEIAEQFKPDHGTSLMDVVTDMRDDIKQLKNTTVTVAADLKDATEAVADEQSRFEGYVRHFVHDTFGTSITLMQGTLEAQEDKLTKVQQVLEEQERRAAEHHPHPHPPDEERRHDDTER